MITKEEVDTWFDREYLTEKAKEAIVNCCVEPTSTAQFISRYADFNSWFGAGVASLAGKIGRSRAFSDPTERINDLADRSMLVGSYFFDAARDEFDDRDTPHRDTHRCLAQACLKASLFFWKDNHHLEVEYVNKLLERPHWLVGLGDRVSTGYGNGTSMALPSLFHSMGYHLGSEILADLEFSLLDQTLRTQSPSLVQFLRDADMQVGDHRHNGYAWIKLHSGDGSAKEMEHFETATRGVNTAFRYSKEVDARAMKHQVKLGFEAFTRDHEEFFDRVHIAHSLV